MIDGSKISTDNLIGVPRNADTHIIIHILANPVPLLQWIFIHGIDMTISCNNTIDSNNTFNGNYISSSILISGQIGKYVIISENSVGVFSQVFTVVLEGKPKSPLIVCVFCKSTSATVVWLQDFNGGQLQIFRVVYWDNEGNLGTEMSHEIQENDTYPEITYTVNDLKPQTNYTFYVVSTNDLGNSRSKMIECSTDEREYNMIM
ncbi:unnamed protein product [Mytilus coruscus]|uniref:Fibronectin type-III domain-containing protein n=1 Tax=Mytilus coruscus TaxID=42192 RepID=A0A6J8AFR7_MYTCO|nr:unnamed protein product [Mytilus coruscus]